MLHYTTYYTYALYYTRYLRKSNVLHYTTHYTYILCILHYTTYYTYILSYTIHYTCIIVEFIYIQLPKTAYYTILYTIRMSTAYYTILLTIRDTILYTILYVYHSRVYSIGKCTLYHTTYYTNILVEYIVHVP